MEKSVFWHKLLPDGKPVNVFGGQKLGDISGKWEERCFAVVIGLGLTGSSCVVELCKRTQDMNEKIVGIDARGLGDGATGRNGGHQFGEVAEGTDEIELLNAKVESFDTTQVTSWVNQLEKEEHRARIGLTRTGGVNVTFEEKQLPFYEDFARNTKEPGVKFLRQQDVYDMGAVHAPCNIAGGIYYPSPAQMCPNGIVLGLCDQAIELGAKLYTGTRVGSIEPVQETDTDYTWVVNTTCGKRVLCKHVVHATNGYGIDLLPDRLRVAMRSVRGQCIAAKAPPSTAPLSVTFKSCPESKEEYLIQRRQDSVIVLGGCRHLSSNLGLDCDDTNVEDAVAEALGKQLERLFPDVKCEITNSWCGIMCFTSDGSPIVGRIRERPGQFVAAGFCGHGMVRTFSCGKYIAELICGVDNVSCPEIPKLFDADRSLPAWPEQS